MLRVDEAAAARLARAYLAGDEGALGQLYRTLLPLIRVVAARTLWKAPRFVELNDLVQDAYFLLPSLLASWDGGELCGWLSVRLRLRLTTRYRRSAVEEPFPADPSTLDGTGLGGLGGAWGKRLSEEGHEEAVCWRVSVGAVLRRISLSAEERRLLYLTAVEGASVEEAARLLGLSRWRAHDLAARTAARLRPLMVWAGLGRPEVVRDQHWRRGEGRVVLLAGFLERWYRPGGSPPGWNAAQAAGLTCHQYDWLRRALAQVGLLTGGSRGRAGVFV